MTRENEGGGLEGTGEEAKNGRSQTLLQYIYRLLLSAYRYYYCHEICTRTAINQGFVRQPRIIINLFHLSLLLLLCAAVVKKT